MAYFMFCVWLCLILPGKISLDKTKMHGGAKGCRACGCTFLRGVSGFVPASACQDSLRDVEEASARSKRRNSIRRTCCRFLLLNILQRFNQALSTDTGAMPVVQEAAEDASVHLCFSGGEH